MRAHMYFLSNRMLSCYETSDEMETLANNVIEIEFKERFAAMKALHPESPEDNLKDFMKWARSRQVREVSDVFQIVKTTAHQCRDVIVDTHRWAQFRQWRQNACAAPMQTDTISSVYFTFMHWNAHTLPRRRSASVIVGCSTVKEHAVHIPVSRVPVVQCKRENVIDQCIRQSAPTMRLPRRGLFLRASNTFM